MTDRSSGEACAVLRCCKRLQYSRHRGRRGNNDVRETKWKICNGLLVSSNVKHKSPPTHQVLQMDSRYCTCRSKYQYCTVQGTVQLCPSTEQPRKCGTVEDRSNAVGILLVVLLGWRRESRSS
jgi:hypothetical protein